MKTRAVVLYGGNLVMSIIGASLREKPEFQLRQIDGLPHDIMVQLEAVPPDVILFDLAGHHPDFAISLLWSHPKIMLIGVDLASHRMLVLSGSQSQLLTQEDLLQVMKGV